MKHPIQFRSKESKIDPRNLPIVKLTTKPMLHACLS